MKRLILLMLLAMCNSIFAAEPEKANNSPKSAKADQSTVEKLVDLGFKAEQMQSSLDAMIEGLQGQMVYGFQNEFFQLTQHKSEALKEKFYTRFVALEEGLKKKIAENFQESWLRNLREFQIDFYNKNFTVKEMEEIYKFNSSPTGQKFLKLALPMSNESMDVVHKIIESVAVESENEFRQKMVQMLEETEKEEAGKQNN